MEYYVNGKKYTVSYKELKRLYLEFSEMGNKEFLENLKEAAHLACIIGFFKELPNEHTLSDQGIVHQLIHLLTDPDEPTNNLGEIRRQFNEILKLA